MALLAVTFFSSIAQDYRLYDDYSFSKDWSMPGLLPDRIGLTMGEDPSSEMRVTWRTDIRVEKAIAEIAVATAAPKFWRNAKTIEASTRLLDAEQVPMANLKAHYHTAVFDELLPNTTYAYRVGDGENWSEWFQFKTASADDSGKFTFLYIGDAQNNIYDLWARLIRQAYIHTPETRFIMHAGDLINTAHNDSEWHEWYEAAGWIYAMVPNMATPGNHEYRPVSAEDMQARKSSLSVQFDAQFSFPENGPEGLQHSVYYVDYQNTRFISLNSNEQQELQAQWLEQVLANNPQKWTIITYHHPLFSASVGRDNKNLRDTWKPLFDKYHVDLALQGHDHSYVRGRVGPGQRLVNGINVEDQTGTVYVVTVSGSKMYDLKPNGWVDYEVADERSAENTQLYQSITIEDDRLVYKAFTATGELYDSFELIKPELGPNRFIDRKAEAIAPRYHSNTISYYDQLPEVPLVAVQKRYPDAAIVRVNAMEREGKVVFNVRLAFGDRTESLLVGLDGIIIEE
jgi:3',5'-cyclic AMP phosphodiesterase CpdA